MPPSRMTGVSNAQMASLNAAQTLQKPPHEPRGKPWRGAMMATRIISETPMSAPGMTPARNKRPIEASALTP